jgi:hypothetical protein
MHESMLPILRILPVGGVVLAIFILVLALGPPDGSRSPLTSTIAPARGALVDRERHPEVRQFLILAALKRADELNRLRDLPDTPTRTDDAQDASKVAGLPGGRSESESDETGSTGEMPTATIPVEIGEPSSTELPVTSQEDSGPAIKPAEPAKARRRAAHRLRHTKFTGAPQQQHGFFDIFFGGQPYQPQPNNTKQAQPYGATQSNQTLSYDASQANQAFRNRQTGQPYGANQWDAPYATKPARQSAVSNTNPGPQINPY